MDCPSEERLVRMAIEKTDRVRVLSFDLSSRRIAATHTGGPQEILSLLEPLRLGAKLIETSKLTEFDEANLGRLSRTDVASEAKVLKILLAINGVMFAVEFVSGWIAESTGLIADSLDMLADAIVYGLSLYAVGRAATLKNRAARLSGYMQMLLAMGALSEVIRRLIFGSDPEPPYMIAVSLVALAANISCLLLLSRHREGEVHMKASWIFSTNDVIANIGVITAGVLVLLTKSHLPDLIVGAIITIIVFRGALQILKLSRDTTSR